MASSVRLTRSSWPGYRGITSHRFSALGVPAAAAVSASERKRAWGMRSLTRQDGESTAGIARAAPVGEPEVKTLPTWVD